MADILTAKDADKVVFHLGLVVEFDLDFLTVREVRLCAEPEVSYDRICNAGGRRAECGNGVVKQHRQTLEGIITVVARRLDLFELAP